MTLNGIGISSISFTGGSTYLRFCQAQSDMSSVQCQLRTKAPSAPSFLMFPFSFVNSFRTPSFRPFCAFRKIACDYSPHSRGWLEAVPFYLIESNFRKYTLDIKYSSRLILELICFLFFEHVAQLPSLEAIIIINPNTTNEIFTIQFHGGGVGNWSNGSASCWSENKL